MNFTEVLEEFDAAIRFGCGDIYYNLENDIKEAINMQIPLELTKLGKCASCGNDDIEWDDYYCCKCGQKILREAK